MHLSADVGLCAAADELRRFLAQHQISALNLAGSRASKEPDVGRFIGTVLDQRLSGAALFYWVNFQVVSRIPRHNGSRSGSSIPMRLTVSSSKAIAALNHSCDSSISPS